MKKLNRLRKIWLFLRKKNLNRLFKFVGLGLVVLVLIISVLLGLQDDQISVKEVWVTNITHNSATIAWSSDEPYVGKVVYKPEENYVWPVLFGQAGGKFVSDDRDKGSIKNKEEVMERYTHHVTLVGLKPETSYKFRIAGRINGKEVEANLFTTLDLDKSPRIPDPSYGKVENVNADDTFIIVKLRDQENSSMLSLPLTDQGRYSVDMNYFGVDNIRTSDLSARIVYENRNLAEYTYSMQGYKPLEDIVYVPEGSSIDEVGQVLNGGLLCSVKAEPIGSNEEGEDEGGEKEGVLTGAVPDELQEEDLVEELGLDEEEDLVEKEDFSENQKIGISSADYGVSYDVCGKKAFAERIFNMCGFKYSEKTVALKEKILDVVLTMGERMDEIIYNFWRNDVKEARSRGEPTIYNTALMKAFNVDDIEEVIQAERIRRKQMRENRVDIIWDTSNPRDISVEIALAFWFAESAGTFGDTTNSSSLKRDGKDVGEYLGVSCGTHITEQDWTPMLDWDEVDGPGRWEKEFQRDIACLYGSSSGYNSLSEYPSDPREIGRFIERYGPSRDNFRDLDDPINCGFANKVTRFLTCSMGVERYTENADGGQCTIFPIPNDKYNQTELFYDWDGNTTNNSACFTDQPAQDYLDLTSGEYEEGVMDSEESRDDESNASDDDSEIDDAQPDSARDGESDQITEAGTYEVIDPEGRKVAQEDLDAGQEPDLYRDLNQNDQQDSNENDVDPAGYTFRKTADITEFVLVKGWNLIHIPLEPLDNQGEKISTASELLAEWNIQGAQIKHVAKFENGRFTLYSERENGVDYVEDFEIHPGQGLAVFNLVKESKVVYRGRRLESDEQGSLRDKYLKETFGNVEDDLILMGFPDNYEFDQVTSKSIIENLRDDQVDITLFSRFIANEGKYQNYVNNEEGEFGEPFEISENQGYFVYVKSGVPLSENDDEIEPDPIDDLEEDLGDEDGDESDSEDLPGEKDDKSDSDQEVSEPQTDIDDELNVVVLVYLGDHSSDVAGDMIDFSDQLKGALEESSRFRGYKNPEALPRMKVNIVKEFIIDNSLPATDQEAPGENLMWADYEKIVADNNLCQFANEGLVDEYWIFASGTDGVSLVEVEITDNTDIQTESVRVKNSSCERPITFIGFTHNNTLDNAVHTWMHRAEMVLEAKMETQSRRYFGDPEVYYLDFGQFNQIDSSLRGSCGNVHFPPNATRHYNYCNTNDIEDEIDCSGDRKSQSIPSIGVNSGVYTDCENWSLNGSQTKTLVNCTNWGCTPMGYYKWWFQNMPDEFWEKLINLS